jgi:hypothetical protein
VFPTTARQPCPRRRPRLRGDRSGRFLWGSSPTRVAPLLWRPNASPLPSGVSRRPGGRQATGGVDERSTARNLFCPGRPAAAAVRERPRSLAQREAGAQATKPAGGPTTGWLADPTSAAPIAMGGRTSTSRSLLLVVPSGSGPLFAGTRRPEQRASTTAVDGRLLLSLEKEERRGYHRGSLLQIVQPGRARSARAGACSVYESESAGALAARHESRDRQAPSWPEVGAGVAPEFMPKRNSGPIRRRGPMGDDAALSRLATSRALVKSRSTPAFVLARVSAPARLHGCLCPTAAASGGADRVEIVAACMGTR